jgi:putative ABC transport system permease protein
MSTSQLVQVNRVDENYFKTMGVRLLAGRNLNPGDTSNQVIVNEATIRKLEISKEEAVGQHLFAEYDGSREEYTIVGLVNDYNFNSLKQEIRPLINFYSSHPSYMVVEANTNEYRSLISDLGSAWKKSVAGLPFEYSFLDEDIQQQYKDENTLKKISNSFTVLAILISCLGLFGLAMFTAQQRVKEIGVRKVLGASVAGITSMLSKDFLKLVFISILIASPIAWWVMDKWLADFAYRTPITWWIFLLAGILALLIALITVSFQAVKAAIANPVRSLRTE